MAEIFNLRREKKRRKRASEDKLAEDNRISFGRTKLEKQLSSKRNDLDTNWLNSRKLDKSGKQETDG
jgi:hypothetical protein